MTWTGQSFSVGQVLTAAQMTNLQADITAVANDDSGAPDIGPAIAGANAGAGIEQSDMDTNSVGQSQLKTAFENRASTSTTSFDDTFTATGGIYIIGHEMKITTGPGETVNLSRKQASGTSFLARWNHSHGSDQTEVSEINLYYINSSPPYDLGDGEILLFIFVLLDTATEEVMGVGVAPDPVWMYNGPTNTIANGRDDNGNPVIFEVDESLLPDRAAARANPTLMEEYAQARKDAPLVAVAIDQARKNADKNFIPHPFTNVLPENHVVMLDPVSPVMEDLLVLHDAGEGVAGLISDGFLIIGSDNLQRGGPTGLRVPSVSWKP